MCCQRPHGAFVNPPPGGGGRSSGHRAGFWSPTCTLPSCSQQPAQLHRAILLGPQGALREHAVTDERARDAIKKEQREPGLGAAVFLSVLGWRWCFFYLWCLPSAFLPPHPVPGQCPLWPLTRKRTTGRAYFLSPQSLYAPGTAYYSNRCPNNLFSNSVLCFSALSNCPW